MRFSSPLVRGRLIQRYKRFLADVALDDGGQVTAHVPNPGAMVGLNHPGLIVWLSISDSRTRKLPHTLEMVEGDDGGLIGVNTMHPNRLVAEALEAGAIAEVAAYDRVRREVAYGEASRVDFLLEGDGLPPCYLEIKNCHFHRADGLAEFPDCTAARSAKHLRELEAVVAAGARAVVLFVVQREDCDRFAACHDLDPVFARALDQAADAGVEVLAYRCEMGGEAITLGRRIPWARGAALSGSTGANHAPP